LALFGQFFITASFTAIRVYTAEVYPTISRSTGIAIGAVFGRIGNILFPHILALTPF